MTRYSEVAYIPSISVTSGVTTNDILSATEAIGNTEAGWLDSITCLDAGDIKRGFTMYLFNANVSAGAENAAFSVSDTAVDNLITLVTFSSGGQVDFTNNVWYSKSATEGDAGMGRFCKAAAPSTDASIYCALKVLSTGSKFASSSGGGLQFRFTFKHTDY